jgi:RNA polymerase sigma-B factor
VNTDELFRRWRRDGDRVARDLLLERFMPLAHSLARRYAGALEPLEDLQQVASLGLLKAIERFDPEKGNAFSSFAVPTILGELKRYFRDYGWSVHVPRGAQEAALALERAQQQLKDQRAGSPSISELAEHLHWSVERVLDALEAGAAHHSVSLDAPAGEASGGERVTVGERLGALDPQLEHLEGSLSFTAALRALSEREQRVLVLRFVEDLTQSEIAATIGVSQMQVSRILRGAIERLRAALLPQDPCAPKACARPSAPGGLAWPCGQPPLEGGQAAAGDAGACGGR